MQVAPDHWGERGYMTASTFRKMETPCGTARETARSRDRKVMSNARWEWLSQVTVANIQGP